MNARAIPGMSARAMRDFGQALREDTFRVALALSLLVHLILLVAFGLGGRERTEEKLIPLMRVRILQSAPGQDAAAPAAVRPEALSAPREGRKRAAAPAPPAPQPASPASVSPAEAPPAAREPAPAPAAVTAPATAAPRPQAEAAPAPAMVTEAAAPSASSPEAGAVLHLAATARGEAGEGAGPLSPLPAPAAAGTGEPGAGTGPPSAAFAAGAGEASGDAGDGGSVGGGVVAAASSGTTPGPYDIAAVRRRIDARKVYPRIAVRNGWEGRVLVEMHLEGDGRLAAVRLLEGSGYAVLDEATLTAVRHASPFPPVARVLTVPVEYRLVP